MALLKSQQTLKTGSPAPDFSLPGTDGKTYSLASFKEAKAILVIIMCNHCPYVIPKVETMKALQRKFWDQGLRIIGINANDTKTYPEDNFENMQAFVTEHGLNFPYVFDESQKVPKAYGATCTPDPFLFDAEKKLVYHGRFDDALSPGDKSTTKDMEEAIDAVLKGEKPKTDFLYSMGCSIKWR